MQFNVEQCKNNNQMKNWNSRTKEYTDIVRDTTRTKASKAVFMYNQGIPVVEICKDLGVSKTRVYDYLRD